MKPFNTNYIICLLVTTLLVGCQSKPVDIDTRRKAQYELATSLGTVSAHQQFLNFFSHNRPVSDKFAKEYKISSDIVQNDKRSKLLAMGLAKQIDYLIGNNKFALDEVLAAVIGKTNLLPKIEQIQWMSRIARVGIYANEQNSLSMQQILGVPKRQRYDSDGDSLIFGPTGLSYLEMANFALRSSVFRSTPYYNPTENDIEQSTAHLLVLATYNHGLRWVSSRYGRYSSAPKGVGVSTSVRREAAKALHRFIGADKLVELAMLSDTLTSRHARISINELLKPESKYDKGDFFPAIVHFEGPEVASYLKSILEDVTESNRLPAMLELVRRSTPEIEVLVTSWLASNDWKQQVAAMYAIALFEWETEPFELRLTELAKNEKRIVRQAVAMAKNGLGQATTIIKPSDMRGTASADYYLQRLERGFTAPKDQTFVDIYQRLPQLDFSEGEPASLNVSANISFFWIYGSPEKFISELKGYFRSLRIALEQKTFVLQEKSRLEKGAKDNIVSVIPTLGVLQREQELWLDPEAEKRWLLWPNAYFCYLDSEQDKIVGVNTGTWGMRLLKVPPDVALSVRRIFSQVGIHHKYPGIEGGVVLVATPEFLKDNHYGPEIYQNAWHNLLNTSKLSDGRQLVPHLVGTLNYTRELPFRIYPFSAYWGENSNWAKRGIPGFGELVGEYRAMSGDTRGLNYASELVFAPTTGKVMSIEDNQTGLQVKITNDSGTIVLSHLHAVVIKTGSLLTRGQWIGIKERESAK